jgi:hypothetical protein
MFTVLAGETAAIPTGELWRLGARYMSFLQYAFNTDGRRFRNFLGYDHRSWLEDVGSQDSHGRSLRALGTVVARWPRQGIREWASQLFEIALPPTLGFTSPRAWAFTLLGIEEYLTRFSGDRVAEDTRVTLGERLLTMYQENSTREWPWFEDQLAYSNAKLPHALLVAGRALRRADMTDAALKSLSWLAQIQCAHEGHFVPIGNHGFYPRDGERARFDQQPIEAQATVSACLEAHMLTGEKQWMTEAQRAFDWFLGRNDLHTPIYDPGTGGCHDGLGPDHVNCNQGAESTLAFLLSLVQMRLAESAIEVSAPAPLVSAIIVDSPPAVEPAVTGTSRA